MIPLDSVFLSGPRLLWRLDWFELINAFWMLQILEQCTQRLGVGMAARRLYTNSGMQILHMEQLIQWAVETHAKVRLFSWMFFCVRLETWLVMCSVCMLVRYSFFKLLVKIAAFTENFTSENFTCKMMSSIPAWACREVEKVVTCEF